MRGVGAVVSRPVVTVGVPTPLVCGTTTCLLWEFPGPGNFVEMGPYLPLSMSGPGQTRVGTATGTVGPVVG